jgi:hypothetical protein
MSRASTKARAWVACQHHKSPEYIAKIFDHEDGVYVHTWMINPVRSQNSRYPLDEIQVPLTGRLAEARGHLDRQELETWCRRCGGWHALPMSWLRRVAAAAGTFKCPCPKSSRDSDHVLDSNPEEPESQGRIAQ